MKTNHQILLLCTMLLAALSTFSLQLSNARAQGTAFTYQGRLQNNGSPASGTFNLHFSLYAASTGGTAIAGPVTTNSVPITNGLFTVTVDFGTGVFNGTAYWLEIGVETNGGSGFVTLTPRQELTPAPYTIFAEDVNAAGINGAIPAANINGTYGDPVDFNNGANSFDGSFYGEFYGATFTGGNFVGNFVGTGSDLTDVWHIGGNFGTTAGADFIGTTDNEPLEFHVNNQRALRLEPAADTANVSGAVNVIGGSPVNFAAPGVQGATIGGGGALNYFGGGTSNRVASGFDTIGGGVNNDIETNAFEATIAGGNANSILPGGYRSTIGGGWDNTIETNSEQSVIGGGILNTIQAGAFNSVISGGQDNVIAIPWAVIAGGYFNTNSGLVSFIGAGDYNSIGTSYSAIAGGVYNQIQTNASFSNVGGGYRNQIDSSAQYSSIGGGLLNQIYGDTNNFGTGVIAGGDINVINSNSWNAFIGGGQGNVIGSSSDHAAVVGGSGNQADGVGAFIGGGQNNSIQTSATYATVAGGVGNVVGTTNYGSTIGGGSDNQIQSSFYANAVVANTIAGGLANVIQSNVLYSMIGGGQFNTNNGYSSTIPGGDGNYTAGSLSFAAGYHAQALYAGDFVWADDSQTTNFASTAANQVSFRCLGGVVFTSGTGGTAQSVSWTPGSASWSFSSDRNLKDHFAPVDDQSVLAKVARLPIVEWSYKGYSQRHIGAMAQDFHAAFPLNHNDKTLNDADLHGVELAAIQGLNQKVEVDNQMAEARIRKLEAENAELQHRLEGLEQLILKQSKADGAQR